MKHCLIISAYKDVKQLNNIIDSTPSSWGIYVHLDKKSKIKKEDINSRAHVYRLKKVYWGGYEHLYVFCCILTMAFNDGEDYDYYHLITGQDYYASSPHDFDAILGDSGFNYISVHKIPWKAWTSWNYGYAMFQYRSLASFLDIHNSRLGSKLNTAFLKVQEIFHLLRPLPKYPMYGGSLYCSLHRDFVGWLQSSQFASDLLKYLRNTTCSEEVYFQTVLMNSPFKSKCSTNLLRYIDWKDKNPPKYLTEEDFESIRKSKSLFCRKVDSSKSQQLIELINQQIL